jgi:tRNA U54 and U55 pseudouridine synthase Pus10
VRSKLKRTFGKKGITAKTLTTTAGPPGEQKNVSLVKVTATLDTRVSPDRLKLLEQSFEDGRVTFYSVNKRRFLERIVYSLKVLEARRKQVTLKLLCDLGLPINRFIDGLRKDSENIEDIHPSVAEVLGVQASCRRFDILAVKTRKPS